MKRTRLQRRLRRTWLAAPHPDDIPKALGRSAVSKGPERDRAILSKVHAFPCLICGRYGVEAHHIRECFPATMGKRISDRYTVPLCRVHHRELHEGAKAFWARNEIDPVAWCEAHLGDAPEHGALDGAADKGPVRSP